MEDEIFSRFLNEADKYPQMWDSLEAKALFADKNGVPILLGLYCTLSSGLIPQSDVVFESMGLTMVKEVLPLSQLRELLAGLQSGQIPLAGRNVKVEGFTQFGLNSWAGGGQGWIDTTYPYVVLHSNGKSTRELVNEDDIMKQLLAYGYRDIDTLSQEKLGFQVGRAYLTQIQIIAPIFLEARATFTDNKLRLVLRCWPSLKVSDLSASFEQIVNMFGKRESKRSRLDLSDSFRLEEGIGFSLVKEMDLLPQIESVIMWVFHATRSDPMYALRVTKTSTLRSNLIWGASSLVLTRQTGGQIKEAPNILRDSLGLDNQVKDAGRLEVAVHMLLGCAGFICIFSGREWGIQGIDTLAFSSTMTKVVAISVTSTNNIGEKIRTMLPQLNKLNKELPEMRVLAVIAAPIDPETVLDSDQRDAKAHDISLILRPQLAQMLDGMMNMAQDKFIDLTNSLLENQDKGLLL